MTVNKKFSFQLTVQSLARILAQIKPTPWEKVCVEWIVHQEYCGHQIMSIEKSINFRCKHCSDIVPKRMPLGCSASILEPRTRSSPSDCISLKVDASMPNKSLYICCVWPRPCPKLFGSTMVNHRSRTVSDLMQHCLTGLRTNVYLCRHTSGRKIQFLLEHVVIWHCGLLPRSSRWGHPESSGNA